FGISAVLLKAGAVSWDASLFRILNEVPAGGASVLTPLSRLLLPVGIAVVVVIAVGYVVVRKRERPARGRRGGGRGRCMGGGARGEGASPPPPALPGDSRRGAAPASCARH